mmetsp:Transcript_11984/g.25874  ORF Transcript_11984/g.25874 Transcript_11984/m.25874 type:complete len:307 (+) Transcript_11984:24-944(+)|eukprot:CAMPEP_0204317928 /NCGR_PEP_ID=MMETSP0469-20131031/6244_1 /ASSEMBLY_ACC=CAM_ASM_000384 /TAXON_ID=2969 /ORGANISM="Oxyrrhis marina" /LENGTH=306 /DNA_ID=CAMNT_0051298903 /DNA_START=15 /DNA_END=935 /DNA_ORIENTATION=-
MGDFGPAPAEALLPDDLRAKVKFALIGGSAVPIPEGCTTYRWQTPFGHVGGLSFLDEASTWLFVPRHNSTRFTEQGKADYAPPHAINYKALIWALKDLGVQRVVAFGSAGSLHPDKVPVGSVCMPDDYFMVLPEATTYWPDPRVGMFGAGEGQVGQIHYTPATRDDPAWVQHRKEVQAAVQPVVAPLLDSKDVSLCADQTAELWPCCKTLDVEQEPIITYVMTVGPRFETRSEIRHYARCGDVVGMTCGKEWALCGELNLPYVLICTIDNSCNGLSTHPKGALQEYIDHKPHVATVVKAMIQALIK